jgi:hypothetical protein
MLGHFPGETRAVDERDRGLPGVDGLMACFAFSSGDFEQAITATPSNVAQPRTRVIVDHLRV